MKGTLITASSMSNTVVLSISAAAIAVRFQFAVHSVPIRTEVRNQNFRKLNVCTRMRYGIRHTVYVCKSSLRKFWFLLTSVDIGTEWTANGKHTVRVSAEIEKTTVLDIDKAIFEVPSIQFRSASGDRLRTSCLSFPPN